MRISRANAASPYPQALSIRRPLLSTSAKPPAGSAGDSTLSSAVSPQVAPQRTEHQSGLPAVLALRESALAIDHIVGLSGVDPQRIGILGFSLGSYLSIFVAGKDPRITSIALVAGGDLPARTPFASLVRTVADPIRAVKALAGRPLLMMDGTRDRMILPDQARALFAAAAEPKELRWYEGGHHPPRSAVDDAAQWMASRLEARPSAPSAPPGAPEGSSQSPRLRKAS